MFVNIKNLSKIGGKSYVFYVRHDNKSFNDCKKMFHSCYLEMINYKANKNGPISSICNVFTCSWLFSPTVALAFPNPNTKSLLITVLS